MKKMLSKRKILFSSIFSMLIASFCVISFPFSMSNGYAGFSFYSSVSIRLLTLPAFFLIFIFSFIICSGFFSVFETHSVVCESNAYPHHLRLLYTHPFAVSFFTLLLLYTPYIIVSYPGILHVDSVWILWRVLGYEEMTTHFPFVYSLVFAHSFDLLSSLFNSNNIALFIISFCQFLLVIGSISFSIKAIIEIKNIKPFFILLIVLFYTLCPLINNYMMNVTKDVVYAALLLLFGTLLWYLYIGTSKRAYKILFIVTTIFLCLTRNEGIYVICACMLVFFILSKNHRILAAVSVLFSIIIFLLTAKIIPNILNITPGSGREMLTIPLMQTARYVFSSEDQITEREEKILLDCFEFDSLDEMAKNYDPSTSDWIKTFFEYDITSENAKNYYKIWFDMLKKRPDIYISSIIASNYQFFFPSCTFDSAPYNWSEDICFKKSNASMGTNLYYPEKLDSLRNSYEQIRDSIFTHFPTSIFNCPAIYTWIIILWLLWALYSRNYSSILLISPAIIVTAICILSPCNAFYARYQYPILIYLPCSILISSKSLNS